MKNLFVKNTECLATPEELAILKKYKSVVG